MRWTVWLKRTSCQNCGAKIPVPETGLTMTCQYCGTESPVPDIEDRKQKQNQEQEQLRRERAHATDQHEEARPEGRAPRPPPTKAQGGSGRGLLGFLLTIGIIGAVLHFTGTLSRFTEPLIGDDGRTRYDDAEAPLKRDGYVRVTQEKTERAFSATKLYLDLEPGNHYALVLGSGQPLSRVTLRNPRGRQVLRRDTLRFQEALLFTPKVAGVYTAAVQLERPGRYRWALMRGPKAHQGDQSQDMLSKRRQRLKQRRSRRRHRSTRPSRASSRARQRSKGKTNKAPPSTDEKSPPSPPLQPPPGPKADDDIKRAIKAGEIEDVDSL
jgi:predicted RNA-binding Zn-ribbon protein involved in translation (DUF1610 family)